MKRIIAIAIAMFMVVTSLALTACGGPTPDGTTTSSTTATTQGNQSTTASTDATTEPTTTEKTEPTVEGYDKPDGYLDVDFGDITFKFITTSDMSDEVGHWQTEHEIAVDSREGGSIIDTAVYDRNAVMKKLYHCNIVAETGDAGSMIKDEVTSGGSTIAFGSSEYYQFNSNGSQLFTNLYDLDIDLNMPGWNIDWFNQVSVKDSAGNMKLFTFDGDFNLMGYKGIWVLAMNLDLYEQNFDEDIFEVVSSGNWTIDKMIELCTKVTNETGDQEMKVGDDTFGLLTTVHNSFGLIAGSNIHFIKNTDGVLTTSVDIIKENSAIDAIDKMIELYQLDGVKADNGYTSNQTELENGRTLFIGEVLNIVERCKDVEDLNITILPEPKYSAQIQDHYVSYVQNKSSTYFVSKNACDGNTEVVSDFLNLFVYHSNKIVLPAFKTAYGSLYCQNSKSVDMLELIMASRIYDYGYYGAGMYGLAGEYLTTGTNSLSSAANKWVARTLNPLISNFVSALDKTN